METSFHPSMGLFQDKADYRSDSLEDHHRTFPASDDIWALENSVVHFFILPHRQSSVPFAYLIPTEEQQSRRGESDWEFDTPE